MGREFVAELLGSAVNPSDRAHVRWKGSSAEKIENVAGTARERAVESGGSGTGSSGKVLTTASTRPGEGVDVC